MRGRQVFVVFAVLATVVAVALTVIPDSDELQQKMLSANVSGGELPATPAADTPADGGQASVTTPPEEQPQPDLPDLAPGKPAPQFVVMSFDGGVEAASGIMKHYLDLAKEVDGHFSFYVSGVYLLPDASRNVYHGPKHAVGVSDIGFADEGLVGIRIKRLTDAYHDGDEIGTHYMGHFCGAGGVGSWSAADWSSEIAQFNHTIDNWRQYSPAVTVPPLPFDSSVIKGGRTPCLAGQYGPMHEAFAKAGYKYDTSGIGELEWPKKVNKYGMWDFPMPLIKVPGAGLVTAMDYNLLANQNGAKTTADPSKCETIEDSAYQAYMDAFNAVRAGNRAPLIYGNHMNNWVCGAYTNALTRFAKDAHEKDPDTKFISAIDLVNWLDRQDPALLAQWQAKPPQAQ